MLTAFTFASEQSANHPLKQPQARHPRLLPDPGREWHPSVRHPHRQDRSRSGLRRGIRGARCQRHGLHERTRYARVHASPRAGGRRVCLARGRSQLRRRLVSSNWLWRVGVALLTILEQVRRNFARQHSFPHSRRGSRGLCAETAAGGPLQKPPCRVAHTALADLPSHLSSLSSATPVGRSASMASTRNCQDRRRYRPNTSRLCPPARSLNRAVLAAATFRRFTRRIGTSGSSG